MNYLELLERIWKYLTPLSRYNQSLHFAYWIVPAAVVLCWYMTIETQDSRMDITVIPLKSSIGQDKQTSPKNGFLVITNDLQNEFKIPLKDSAGISEVWTSLEDSILKLNDDRILISPNNNFIKLNMPLYSQNKILGIVLNGEAKGEVNMVGKSISFSKLVPVSNISIWLVLAVISGIAFGFGLIIGDFSRNY